MATEIVRFADDADMEAVAAIFEPYVRNSVATFEREPPSPAAWRRKRHELAARGLPFLVVCLDGRVVGYAYASPWRDKPGYRHTAEDTIYLEPAATGRGLGMRLLEPLIESCRAAGIRQLIAVIADTGLPASEKLHRACGFRVAGRLRKVGYKHDRWIDTLLMQRELAPAETRR